MEDEEADNKDVVLHLHGGGLQKIHNTNHAHDARHFVLLFPHGTDGWHLGLQNISQTDLYSFHIQYCQKSIKHLTAWSVAFSRILLHEFF